MSVYNFILEETSDQNSLDIAADDEDETRTGTIEAPSSEDVIMISSSEGNTNECNTYPGNRICTI